MVNQSLNFFANRSVAQVFRDQNSRIKGLTNQEVYSRQKRDGKNILVEEKQFNFWGDIIIQFRNPLILILLFAALFSYLLGDVLNALIIAGIVVVSTGLNFFQERKASQAASKLKERLRSTAMVMRAGKEMEIAVKDICVGDLLVLNAGDLIPADARVIEAKDFFVNQSSLTGESFPVEKVKDILKNQKASLSELHNIVFSGTNVVTGTAQALVLKIGKETEFGKIAKNITQREDQTEFTMGVNKFSNMILRITILIVLAIFLFNAVLKRDVLESFLFAVAVAVGLTPELLPMILSVAMSSGSVKMAAHGVIVKKLVAIPNFGSMDILCTDKTGTLTEDRIVLVKYMDIEGNESDQILTNAYLNSFFQTGIANPLDEAVLKFKKIDLKNFQKIDEVPFDFRRKRMSVVVQGKAGRMLICKGAPEEVFDKCKNLLVGKKSLKLTPKMKQKVMELYRQTSSEGYRVLAIATKKVGNLHQRYDIKDEEEMTLNGFIAFLDPTKTDAQEIVKDLRKAGVDIKIITGDNELVTKRVCTELKIPVKGILLGHQIVDLTDDALRVAAEKTTIFARFSPDEKNRIIHALRAGGHVVGYMGDGINDAPSLKTADVGISVENAVDVAKESADIILTEKSLEVLRDGILEGRKTFGNSMKYIMMGVSSNFGNMLSVMGAVIFLPFFPMLPAQILLNNLLYDFSQISIPGDSVDQEYISSPKRWDLSFVKKFMIVFGLISSLFDFLTFYVLFGVFHLDAAAFQTGWFMESLATQTLIIHIIRTKKIPFLESRPSNGLMITTFLVIAIGWILPYTALGAFFGLVSLPINILMVLGAIIVFYLVTVEVGKRIFYSKIK